MNHKLSMLMRSAVVSIIAACTSGDDPVAGAGAGGAPIPEGASPACVRWAKAFAPCLGGGPSDLRDLLAGCLSFGPCQAEAEAYWTCSAEGLEKNCDPSCPQNSGALDYCMLTVATCEVEENSCSCVGETFKPDSTFVTCEVIEAEPAGGGGGGGGEDAGGSAAGGEDAGGSAAGGGGAGGGVAGQIVQCTCGYGDTLTHICQQPVLDCGLGTSCCWDY